MKKATFLFVLMFSLVLIITSCSKNDDSNSPDGINGTKLRITKMSNNIGMQGGTSFTYNANGLLSGLYDSWSNFSYTFKFEYESKNNPVKITLTYFDGKVSRAPSVLPIEWSSNSFTTTADNYKDTYFFNINNQIIKKTTTYNGITKTTNYLWKGDSLIVSGSEVSDGDRVYKYVKKNNPFSSINLAIIAIYPDEFEYGWLQQHQNTYCTTDEYVYYSSKNIAHNVIKYTYNAQNYPIRSETPNIEDITGKSITYTYFEYESY